MRPTAPGEGAEFLFRTQQASTHWIQVNVVADRQQIAIAAPVDDEGFVSATEEVTENLVATIKSGGVSAHEPPHASDEICTGRLDDEMKMIVHQAIRVNLPVGLGTSLAKGNEKALTIGVVAKDRLATITAIEDVINGTGVFDPECAGHGTSSIARPNQCQYSGLTPIRWRQPNGYLLKTASSDDQKRFHQQKNPGARSR